jgi:hypothetical protein
LAAVGIRDGTDRCNGIVPSERRRRLIPSG